MQCSKSFTTKQIVGKQHSYHTFYPNQKKLHEIREHSFQKDFNMACLASECIFKSAMLI